MKAPKLILVFLFAFCFSLAGIAETNAGPKHSFCSVTHKHPKPGKHYIWVEGHYKVNKHGKLVWIPGHWKKI